jgi:hypothetical protein
MLSKVPKGYKAVHQHTSEFGSIQEFVPEGENLSQWTEMLTVQILPHRREWTLSEFRATLEELWRSMNPGSSSELIEQGFEGLNPMLFWSLTCPLNRKTAKPEMTWIKIVMQNGYSTVVQKAFKFRPPADAIAFWVSYLRDVRVNENHSR